MGLLGDIISGGLGIANTYYNVKTNERDFDYQKALQQQIFEREDTAVQRRMADLEAAGINPNLAAGSAAGAGSVVARSSTNDVDFGAVLDTLMAKRQLEQQKQQTENLKTEGDILKNNKILTNIQKAVDAMNSKVMEAETLTKLGIPYYTYVDNNGQVHIAHDETSENKKYKSKISDIFDYQLNTAKNSADLLQKDLDYYNMDKAFQYVSKFMPDVNFGIKYGIK